MFYFGSRTFIVPEVIALIAVAAGFLALGAHYLFFRKWQRYFLEVLAYSFLGWGSLLCASFLLLNFLVFSNKELKIYELKDGNIINIDSYFINSGEGALAAGPLQINVEDALFERHQHLLSFEADEIKTTDGKVTEAWFTVADGLFGYKILLNKELH